MPNVLIPINLPDFFSFNTHYQKALYAMTLIELCMKIGTAGTGSDETSEHARKALQKLESALAINNPVSADLLLSSLVHYVIGDFGLILTGKFYR